MNARHLLVALPICTFVLVAYAARPSAADCPRRLAVVRAAVLVGGYGVASTEALSAGNDLTPGAVMLVWLAALIVATGAAALRYRRDQPDTQADTQPDGSRPRLLDRIRPPLESGRVFVAVIAGLVLAELVLALGFAPNTYDAQTYHLPRIEHWVAQRNVAFYAGILHRQNTYPPGAEYLLLHLRLLTGDDMFYALLQWSAGVLCIVAVTRMVAQLGGGRRAQQLAALVLASTPLVVLESSSTQTDLVVAAWTACLATLVLDGVVQPATGPSGPVTVALLGLATALIALTKPTGLFAAAPLLLWWGVAKIRRYRVRGLIAAAGAAVMVLGFVGAVNGSFLWQMDTSYGNPLGPVYMRQSMMMQRHDPAAVLVNVARQTHTVLNTPLPALNAWGAGAVEGLSRSLGVNPQDPSITFDNATFPTASWYPSEDKAAFPIQALLALLGVIGCLARPGPRAGPRRVYTVVVLVAALVHMTMLKWQPWGNRLLLYELVLAVPLAGIVLDRALAWRPAAARRFAGARPLVAGAVVTALVIGASAGALAALYGWPRRLVGANSVFTLDASRGRFVTRPEWANDYAAVAAAVRASGAHRVGLVQGYDSWEYPWWLELPDRQILPLQTNVLGHPATPLSDVDAVICVQSMTVCQRYAQNWPVHMHGIAGYALPPSAGH